SRACEVSPMENQLSRPADRNRYWIEKMMTLPPEFDDRGDYFFATWMSVRGEVDVTINKQAQCNYTPQLISTLKVGLDDWIASALAYFDSVKERYGLQYINDLADPHIIVSEDGFSIFWSSELGEPNGDADVAVDYNCDDMAPYGLTIGD
ncbi:hypothetical protein, partial [Novipirellula maiorica]